MRSGVIAQKLGMSRVFTDDGDSIPVTVVDVSNNRVAQIKTPETDGYSAVQIAFGKRRASRVGKPLAGHLAKAAVEAGHTLKEFRADPPTRTVNVHEVAADEMILDVGPAAVEALGDVFEITQDLGLLGVLAAVLVEAAADVQRQLVHRPGILEEEAGHVRVVLRERGRVEDASGVAV